MNPVAIDGIGAITPGAGDAGGSMGLIYTETRVTSELPRVGRRAPELSGAKTPIPDDVVGLDRLVQLGSQALWQAIDQEMAAAKIALLVCAPAQADEPALAGHADEFLARLASESQIALVPRASRVLAFGRDAIFEALPAALGALAQPEVAAACLLGVDSLVTKPRLRQFIERGASAGGDLPPLGEAAAAVLLCRRPRPSALASLAGLGTAERKASETPPGKGLLAAIDRAVADAGLGQPAFAGLVCDASGTTLEADELAWAKNAGVLGASAKMESALPHLATGDAGAAMGVLALAAAAFFIGKQAWQGTGLCCFTSPAKRGAAILAPLGGRKA